MSKKNKAAKMILHLNVLLGLIATIALSVGLWWLSLRDTREGQLAPKAPEQSVIASKVSDFQFREHTLKPLASLHMRARVLSIAWYPEGAGSDIAPLDLALGWGPMSDKLILKHFQVSQSQRWYALSAPKSPITMHSAAQHSANMHIIPANQGLATRLRHLQEGDVIEMKGWLVNVEGEDWQVDTSLTRDDRGAGACEVVYVLSLKKV